MLDGQFYSTITDWYDAKGALNVSLLSHRKPKHWPGGRHCDWRPVGGGHRHCRGGCRAEEDGQILVSSSHTHLHVHTCKELERDRAMSHQF